MTDAPPIPSDRALVDAARQGSDAAWAALRTRHHEAVRAVATATGSDIDGRTDRAFIRLRSDLTAGPMSAAEADGEYVRALRPRALAALTGGGYGPSAPSAPVAPLDAASIDTELPALAVAFARLPESWQTVLWHRHVEHAPASELTARLGRSPSAIVALQTTAERGLFDAYCTVVVEGDPGPLAGCRPIVTQLGGYRRGTLPSAQTRAVDAHLSGGGGRPGPVGAGLGTDGATAQTPPGCVHCARRLAVGANLGAMIAAATVPALTGLTVARYRDIVGAPDAAVGSSTLVMLRSERASRRQRAAAVAAVALALLAAAYFIRAPFGNLTPELARMLEEADPPPTLPSNPATTPDDAGDPAVLLNRIELIFPGDRQGAVYVPGGRALNLSVDLSTPGPVLAGATGTIDADITNNDTVTVSIPFFLRVSEAVSFDALSGGDGTCRREDDDGATCSLTIGPGETASMSLRFGFSTDAPARLVVDPGVESPSLEVPVHTIADLLVGLIGRGESQMIGGRFGSCDGTSPCTDGTRDATSADLALAPDAEVELALLVWEGQDSTRPWARAIGLVTPAGDASQPIEPAAAASLTTVAAPFRSVADVTESVRAAGPGRYTIVRPPGGNDPGSWTLVVVSSSPAMPRRLVVVTAPSPAATAAAPLLAEFPLAGSHAVDIARSATLSVQGRTTTSHGAQALTAGARPVGGADPFGVRDASAPGGEVKSYDLEIASTEDALSIVASTTDGALRVAVIGVTLDLAP